MNASKKFVTLAVASLIAAAPLTVSFQASAAEAKKPAAEKTTPKMDAVAKTTNEATDAEIVKTVDEAYRSLREIHAARLAIFNGEVDQAVKFANTAVADMTTAQSSAKDFMIPTKKASNGDKYIPFDVSIALSEGFVATPEKQAKIREANGHLAKGDQKKAAEVLKLANIDVVVSAALVPVNASVSHLKDAVKLIGEKKYYEANLAMKAVEDAIVVESFGLDDVPVQGKAG